MVGEGKQYEDLVGEIISPKCQANRYGKQPQSRIGATPWGTTHSIDWEIWSLDNPNLRALLSCKYQDSGGTAEEKIPYEVIKLARAVDLDHAVALANATNYGLAAGVFTQDLDAAMWCAERLNAGMVHVNEWALGSCEVPFGGTRHSGIGRERGREGLEGYLQSKVVGIRRNRSFAQLATDLQR